MMTNEPTDYSKYLGTCIAGKIEKLLPETQGQHIIDEYDRTHYLFGAHTAPNGSTGDKVGLVYRSWLGQGAWYAHVTERAAVVVPVAERLICFSYEPIGVSPIPPTEATATVPSEAVEPPVRKAASKKKEVEPVATEITWDKLNADLEEGLEQDDADDDIRAARNAEVAETISSIADYADEIGVSPAAVHEVLVSEEVPMRPNYTSRDLMRIRDQYCGCEHKGRDHKRYLEDCLKCECQFFHENGKKVKSLQPVGA